MKEDYLWDKTGGDPEIEKLENVLKAFRQPETAPSLIPTQTLEFDSKNKPHRSPWRLFSLGMASFACLAVAIFGVLLFQMNRSIGNEMVKTELAGEVEKPAAENTAEPEHVPITTKITKVDDAVENSGIKSQRNSRVQKNKKRALRTRNLPKAFVKVKSKRKSEDQEVILTKEEKYAYDQLMLGLSITSSNLKMVKDKANGIRRSELPKRSGS